MRSYTERDAALGVYCRECDALPGHVCIDASMQTVPVHEVRCEDLHRHIVAGNASYQEEGLQP